MSLTKIGSIGINTGIAFAGVTTIVTLNTANDALSIGATVNVGSGITLGASGDVFFTGIATGNGSGLTALNASNIGSGTVPTARLGSGTASSSTFLRGDSTFQTVITDLVNDTSPQLGGDLDTNSFEILLDDNHKIKFGDSSDLEIQHNTNENYIDSNSGHIYIRANVDDDEGDNIYIQAKAGEDGIIVHDDGPVELYYDNARVFETDTASVKIRDNIKAKFGTGDDLQLYHDGTNSVLSNATGTLYYLAGTQQMMNLGGTETMAKFIENGAVELYHNNNKHFETATNGGIFRGTTWTAVDNCKFAFGTGDDLQIFHNGNHSFIEDSGTGNLFVKTSSFQLENAAGNETLISAVQDGAVELYHNNSKKVQTESAGITVFGSTQVDGTCHPYSDNASDLGLTSNRWQDLYLSGNIYLGGTGSSNALDDYEEGTFTPTFSSGYSYAGTITYTNQTGHYTKIGNQVFAYIYLRPNGNSAHSGNIITDGNGLTVTGLPFTNNNTANNEGGGYITYMNGFLGSSGPNLYHDAMPWVPLNDTRVIFHTPEDGNNVVGTETTPTNKYFIFQVRYHV